jgi:hypothetical protein
LVHYQLPTPNSNYELPTTNYQLIKERRLSPSSVSTAAPSSPPWYRTITREQWRVLVAAKVGWMLDAMDFMLYAVALNQLRVYFQFDDATAGMLGTVT